MLLPHWPPATTMTTMHAAAVAIAPVLPPPPPLRLPSSEGDSGGGGGIGGGGGGALRDSGQQPVLRVRPSRLLPSAVEGLPGQGGVLAAAEEEGGES